MFECMLCQYPGNAIIADGFGYPCMHEIYLIILKSVGELCEVVIFQDFEPHVLRVVDYLDI